MVQGHFDPMAGTRSSAAARPEVVAPAVAELQVRGPPMVSVLVCYSEDAH